MNERPLIVACIPAFNEEKTIGRVVLLAQRYADRVIVCDDGSRDMTAEIAERLGAEVIRHERNLGYGAAIQSLFRRARELGADVMVTLDADGQHDPGEIKAVAGPILSGEADIVVGSRFLGENNEVPLYRRLGIKAITRLTGRASGNSFSDAQSGFRAYNRKAIEGLRLNESGMGVSTEVLLRAGEWGLRVVEVPVGCNYRSYLAGRVLAENSSAVRELFTSGVMDMAIAKDQVTVVIPVLNEEKAIGLVLDEVRRDGYSNILVIDGYSSDDTVRVAADRDVRVVQQHASSKTGAIKTAVEYVTTPYMVVIDGDHTYCAKDIERFLNHADRYVHIIGVRDRANIGLVHRFGNWVITHTFNLLMGTGLSDVCSGMYLLKTEVARELELNSKGFRTEVEIAAQTAIEHGITEVPISYKRRVGKRKLSTWRHGLEILFAVVDLARRYNPVLLFSAVSALSVVPAIAILMWVAFRQLTVGVWHSGWALLGVMLLLFASQSWAVATLSILLKRMEKRIVQRLKEDRDAEAIKVQL